MVHFVLFEEDMEKDIVAESSSFRKKWLRLVVSFVENLALSQPLLISATDEEIPSHCHTHGGASNNTMWIAQEHASTGSSTPIPINPDNDPIISVLYKKKPPCRRTFFRQRSEPDKQWTSVQAFFYEISENLKGVILENISYASIPFGRLPWI